MTHWPNQNNPNNPNHGNQQNDEREPSIQPPPHLRSQLTQEELTKLLEARRKEVEANKEEARKMHFGIPSIILGILMAIAGIIILCVIAMFIGEASEWTAKFAKHIVNLFRHASLDPRDSRDFAKAMQLIMIAIFVGWTINRFKNKKK